MLQARSPRLLKRPKGNFKEMVNHHLSPYEKSLISRIKAPGSKQLNLTAASRVLYKMNLMLEPGQEALCAQLDLVWNLMLSTGYKKRKELFMVAVGPRINSWNDG